MLLMNNTSPRRYTTHFVINFKDDVLIITNFEPDSNFTNSNFNCKHLNLLDYFKKKKEKSIIFVEFYYNQDVFITPYYEFIFMNTNKKIHLKTKILKNVDIDNLENIDIKKIIINFLEQFDDEIDLIKKCEIFLKNQSPDYIHLVLNIINNSNQLNYLIKNFDYNQYLNTTDDDVKELSSSISMYTNKLNRNYQFKLNLIKIKKNDIHTKNLNQIQTLKFIKACGIMDEFINYLEKLKLLNT